MNKLMLSCKKATELMDRKNYILLSRTEKFQLLLHKNLCDACRQYEKQSAMLDSILKRHNAEPDESIPSKETLSQEKMDDPALLAVLLDNAASLQQLIVLDNTIIHKVYSFNCTFTPLYKASLLHLCAEYNHTACARVLLNNGADVNGKAGIDENGFGGQTPIFHTVNQDANKCMEMMKLLIAEKADLSITLNGIIWGKGYDWETFIPAVNPISYAMMGLLRQFQRTEKDCYEIVSLLMEAKFGTKYLGKNIPNRYLEN